MKENIICDNCEEINSFDSKFCNYCGKPLEKKASKNKFINFFKYLFIELKKSIVNNLYLILLATSSLYLLTYLIINYFVANRSTINYAALGFGKDLAIIVFSAGIFTCSLKYLQYLKVFRKEFEEILYSREYHDQIKKNIESITLSEEFFLKQNNLENIWQTVTLSKYKKEFPELYNRIKLNLKNELFEKSNIKYYYKNVTKQYVIELLENNKVQIKESTKYTIVRNTKEKFYWDCEIKVLKEDSDNGRYPEIDVNFLNQDGIDFDNETDVRKHKENKYLIKIVECPLYGKKEYHVERKVTLVQNLNNDREYSFGSSRLIDDLTVSVRYKNNLKVVFSQSGNVNFIKEENKELGNYTENCYINRELMLPGEKFKLFFIKAN